MLLLALLLRRSIELNAKWICRFRGARRIRSTQIIFGAQSAAAELSTGALVLRAIADLGLGPESISMLVVSMDAKFGKKAKSLTSFYCGQGEAIHNAVLRASRGEDVTLEVETVGRMADGAEVSRFRFMWAVKAKSTEGRSGGTTRNQ